MILILSNTGYDIYHRAFSKMEQKISITKTLHAVIDNKNEINLLIFFFVFLALCETSQINEKTEASTSVPERTRFRNWGEN